MPLINKLILAVMLVVLVACETGTPVDRYPAVSSLRPRSILIVPVVNQSVDVNASTAVLSTLPKVLADQGYYVFPVNTVKVLLEHEGLYEPAEVHAEQVPALANLFGADSVLYVVIREWTAKYVLIQTTTIVDLEYRWVGANGAELWSARKRLSYSPSDNARVTSSLDGLISAAIGAALERADPQYLPLTRQANTEVFETGATALPPGPYAPSYKDYYKVDKPETTDSKQSP